MSEAEDKGKVRLIDANGNRFRFKNIILDNGKYYGITHGKTIQLPDQNCEVQLKDRKRSMNRSVLLFFGVLVGPIVITGFAIWAGWTSVY